MGALTSKPYAFTARSWELKAVQSIDITDCEGANIRLQLRGNTVLRVLPFINPVVNGEWISDRARFSYDALTKQRLSYPVLEPLGLGLLEANVKLKFFATNQNLMTRGLTRSGWELVFRWFKKAFIPGRDSLFGAISPSTPARASYEFKHIFSRLGCGHLLSYDIDGTGSPFTSEPWNVAPHLDFQSADSDLVICLGVNLRFEAPTLFASLRKALQRTPSKRILFLAAEDKGFAADQFFNLGFAIQPTLRALLLGRHPLSKRLTRAARPLVIVGRSGLMAIKLSSYPFLAFFKLISSKIWPLRAELTSSQLVLLLRPGSNAYFQAALATVDPVFTSRAQAKNENFQVRGRNFFLALGESSVAFVDRSKFAAVLYASSHQSWNSRFADASLPTLSFVEETEEHYNFAGRKQGTKLAISPVYEAARSSAQLGQALLQLFPRLADPACVEYHHLQELEPLKFGVPSTKFSVLSTLLQDGNSNLFGNTSAVSCPESDFYPTLTNQLYYQAGNYLSSSSTMALRAKLQSDGFSNFADSTKFSQR